MDWLESLLSATNDFATWIAENFDTDQADEVSTEQLLMMQKRQQQTLLIVMGLSIMAISFTVFWTGDSPL